jgi:hypothetical protein
MDKKRWLVVLMLAAMVVPSLSWGQGMNPANPRTPQKADPTEKQARIATEFVAKIKAVLPNGWSVKADKNTIIVRRDKPIKWYGTISLPSHNLAYLKAHGFIHSETYTVVLEFFPPMSKAAVDELNEENRRIKEQYYHEHPRPKNVKPSVPWELKQSLHHIPNVLAKNYSVLLTPFIQGPSLAFFNEQEKKECEGVEREVRRLLTTDGSPVARIDVEVMDIRKSPPVSIKKETLELPLDNSAKASDLICKEVESPEPLYKITCHLAAISDVKSPLLTGQWLYEIVRDKKMDYHLLKGGLSIHTWSVAGEENVLDGALSVLKAELAHCAAEYREALIKMGKQGAPP